MGTLLKWPVEAGNNSLKELFSIPQAVNWICHSEPRTIQPNAIMAKCSFSGSYRNYQKVVITSLSIFSHESIGLKSGYKNDGLLSLPS